MSVLGRVLVSSAERLDLPDLLSIDSYNAGDWKYFLKGIVGDTKPYVLKGFDVIDPQSAIGTQSCSIRVADSMVFYPGAGAGSFYHGLQEGHPQAAPIVPELRKNAVNYVYLTFSTFNTSVDSRAFWDVDKDGGAGGEFTQDVNTESVLKVEVNVSTGSFPSNTIPIAMVTVGPVVITAIEDARDMMFRLGSGGINPNPFNSYDWRSLPNSSYERAEPPTLMTAGGVNPFQGGDKNILSLKEWMDAVMSKLRELGGTAYWYQDASSFSLISGFVDALATGFKSKGAWMHDSSTPGLVTWTEDIHVKITADPRTYIFRNGSKTLANEQVMYVPLVRNTQLGTSDLAVNWTNGANYINTNGGVLGSFSNLAKGDWVKKANDPNHYFLRVEEFYDGINLSGSTTSAANARSVRLSSTYLGSTGTENGRYDQGIYDNTEVVVSDRDEAAITVAGGNFHWMALRSDTIENIANVTTTALTLTIDQHDGSTARCVSGSAHNLVDGDRVTISGSTNYDGTYTVEVETSTIFYINVTGGPFPSESGIDGYYALVTTAARSTPYGLQEESANHGFSSGQTITIAGTTNYNGAYLLNRRSATTFTIPMDSAPAVETIGTTTLAKVIVRAEQGIFEILQGETIDIGEHIPKNLKDYIGMQSEQESYPIYRIPEAYNTLDGMVNYNGQINDNLTVRVSKLTAMMADKAQDKTIKYLRSGYISVTNTTNGANQDITFQVGDTAQRLDIVLPGSPANGYVGLTGTLSLAANQAAYITIDRNNGFTVANLAAVTVSAISAVPIQENTLVLATRLSTGDVWLWDGTYVNPDTVVPTPEEIYGVEQEDRSAYFRSNNPVTWTGTQLEFTTDIVFEVLNTRDGAIKRSTIQTAQSPIVLNNLEMAYIEIDRSQPAENVTVQIATTLPPQDDSLNDIIVLGYRVDVAGEGYLHLPFHKQVLEVGQTVRLGASGSGSGGIKARLYDPVNTTLPTGSNVVNVDQAPVPGDGTQYTILNTTSILGAGNGYTANNSGPLTNIVASMRNNGGTGTITARLYSTTANSVPDTLLATSDPINVATLNPSAFADVNFVFSTPYSQVSGTDYVWAIDSTTLVSNEVHLELSTTQPSAYPTNHRAIRNEGGWTWTDNLRQYVASLELVTAGIIIDGVPVENKDRVLFANLTSGNNRIYEASNVETSIVWTQVRAFSGQFDPADADAVRIQEGTSFSEQLAVFDGTFFKVNDTVRFFDGVSANYYEQSSIKSSSLVNNTTDTVFSVTALASENWIVNYSILRGTVKEVGQLLLTHDGTDAAVTQTGAYTAIAGVTFTAAVVADELFLYYTTDNNGQSGVIRYFTSRWSDNVLGGPTGIPNYAPYQGGGGSDTTASNVGTGEGVFKQKVADNLEFKSLIAGPRITLTPGANDITIEAVETTASSVGAGAPVYKQKVFDNFEFKTITAAGNISITDTGDEIEISTVGSGGTPGGADRDIQFNDAGSFGGISNFKISGNNTEILYGALRQSVLFSNIEVLNNDSAVIASFDITDIFHVTIEYSIVRDGAYRTGRLMAVHDGTNAFVTGDLVETAPLGVTMTATLVNGPLEIVATTTNETESAFISYSYRAW